MKKEEKRVPGFLYIGMLAMCIIYVFFSAKSVVKAETVEDIQYEAENSSEATEESFSNAEINSESSEFIESDDSMEIMAIEPEFSETNLESTDLSGNLVETINSDNDINNFTSNSTEDAEIDAETDAEAFSNIVNDNNSLGFGETENSEYATNETIIEDNEITVSESEENPDQNTETNDISETPSITGDSIPEPKGNISEKSSVIPEEETFYVKVSSLAVRPAKNSTVLLGRLTRGAKITGYREGAWIKIIYNGQTAYIAAMHTDTNPVLETLYVQVSSLAVRPAKNSTVLLGRLTRGTRITGYREGAWIKIIYNGQTAYIAAKYTDTTSPLILESFYTVNSVPVRPYKEAKTSLGILPNGTLITGYREGAWTRITYKGQTGYVATRLITKSGLGLILDISQWQDPELMDFDLISDQVSGVIMRIGTSDRVTGSGYFKDEHFERFYEEFTSRNIPVGGYWYSIAANQQEGIGEANQVLKHIQNKKFNLPIYWDTENDTFQKDVSANLLTDAALGFITTLETQGIYTGIYGSAWWLNNKIEMDRLTDYPVWVANYKTNYPAYDREYGLWQFTNEARLAGYPHNLDLSIMYTDYTKTTNSIGPEILYVQSSSLAVRPAKNSTVLLGRLTRDTKVYGYREGAWIRITYKGKPAYIAAKYTDTSPVMETVYVNVSSLAVRPEKNSIVSLGKLTRGTKVYGHREGAWIRISYNGKTAYIAAKFTNTDPVPETIYVKVSSLAVRPAKNSTVLLGRLTKGTKVTGYREGAWIRINYNGKPAYIAAKFTETLTSQKIIYLDPGHGGKDSGAYYSGIREATLNLKISNLVKTGLEKLNYRVIMSRTSDEYIDIYDRAAEANSKNPDIFVSVHNNAFSGNSYVNGIETYYYQYNPKKPPVLNPEMHNDPDRIAKSRNLAEILQNILIKDTGAANREVNTASFVVLRETKIPAVLLELGFMSNPDELQKLTTSAYQNTLANAIVKGIHNYFVQ